MSMESKVREAAQLLGYEDVKEHQLHVISAYLEGRDVFLTAPCGSGKSLCFEVAPFVFNTPVSLSTNNIVIVVQPLVALMHEQVNTLSQKGIKACYLGQPGIMRRVRSGEFNVVFTSPESILAKDSREILLSSTYQKNVKAIFVDESHCVTKWGTSSSEVSTPFRQSYGNLGELRAVFTVPVIAMTATANMEVRSSIAKNLHLHQYHEETINPVNNNIRLSVLPTFVQFKEVTDFEEIFSPIVSELLEKKEQCPRYLLYCHNTEIASRLYNVFSNILGKDQYIVGTTDVNDDRNRLFALFHKTTDDDIKETVINSFGDPHGTVRVLFATVAFGMGMNVKGLHTVIHVGPPEGIDDYIQESGRAGRDSSTQCHSVMILFSGCTRKCNVPMRNFLSNSNECRRKLLLDYFDNSVTKSMLGHLCCDICHKSCTCLLNCKEDLTFLSQFEIELMSLSKPSKQCFIGVNPCYVPTGDQLTALRDELLKFQDSLGDVSFVTSGPQGQLSSGYHAQLINHIIKDARFISSFDVLLEHFEFFNVDHAKSTYQAIVNILGSNTCVDSENSEENPDSGETTEPVTDSLSPSISSAIDSVNVASSDEEVEPLD